METWMKDHRKTVWIAAGAALVAALICANFSYTRRKAAEARTAGLLKEAFEKDVVASCEEDIKEAGLYDIAVTPVYGGTDNSVDKIGSHAGYKVMFTFACQAIDQFYTGGYGYDNNKRLLDILTRVRAVYLSKQGDHKYNIEGQEYHVIVEYGSEDRVEVNSEEHAYSMWSPDRSLSLDVDNQQVYYYAGATADASSGSAAGSGSASGSASGSKSGVSGKWSGSDANSSDSDDYYDDWEDEDEAEESLYNYYGEDGADDYWDSEE